MTPIINPQQLAAILSGKDLVLIDARTGSGIKEKYNQQHLLGALFVDLETEMAHKTADAANGGRHPLPDFAAFAELLGKLGIHPESHVVVYDDKNGANAAARFWWMLRAIGHKQVQVLDGGYDAVLAAGIPTSSGTETTIKQPAYPHNEWQLQTASIQEVEAAANNSKKLIIDVRDAARYRGETEPIDLVAGHIPGAVNIPFTLNLNSEGFYLTPAELSAKYKEQLADLNPEDVTVHCGSGVTACHTLLAMDYAGLGIPKLYVGSWSEWSRSGRPIATGNL